MRISRFDSARARHLCRGVDRHGILHECRPPAILPQRGAHRTASRRSLAYAHAEGVLHRDVKPSNLLLDVKGNVWVTDFGLAKSEGDDELTQTGDFVGTLRYTAPERLEGWSDRRSDLYGLGVTLYELLTFRPYFANMSRAELLRRIADDTPPGSPANRRLHPGRLGNDRPHGGRQGTGRTIPPRRADGGRSAAVPRRSTDSCATVDVLERFGRWCRRNPVVAALAARRSWRCW